MSNVNMPRLSDTMEEGTISRWLKKPGDAIKKGDILAEIETDKANMELESYDAGTLEEIVVQEGETVPIGQVIAVIGSGSGSAAKKQADQGASTTDTQQKQKEQPAASDGDKEAPSPTPVASTAKEGADASSTVASTAKEGAADGEMSAEESGESGENGRIIVSPLARRMAEEHHIDLKQLQGTGPHGRIVRDDIDDFLEQQKTAATNGTQTTASKPQTDQQEVAVAEEQAQGQTGVKEVAADAEVSKMSRVQTIIARRLTESKQTIPHFYVSNEVDMTDILALRQALNANAGEGGVKVSVNDLVIKAVALALEKFPEVNSSIKGDQFLRHKHIHVGMAVDVPSGLVVPVIHDTNIKGVRTIAREAKALIEKARANKLSSADLEGGTFSVSNLGMMDVTDFVAVINPPQAAILAIASTRKQFVPVNDLPVVRDMMPMTMSSDHRILYGATVARFLQEVKRLLQSPYSLLG
ncbi:MAG: dihydrolipoamide acetyltransferase family protein [Ktedonobacteraceae bacterium]